MGDSPRHKCKWLESMKSKWVTGEAPVPTVKRWPLSPPPTKHTVPWGVGRKAQWRGQSWPACCTPCRAAVLLRLLGAPVVLRCAAPTMGSCLRQTARVPARPCTVTTSTRQRFTVGQPPPHNCSLKYFSMCRYNRQSSLQQLQLSISSR